jgi:cytochrome c
MQTHDMTAAIAAAALLALAATPGFAQDADGLYHLGSAATPEQIAGWDIDIQPDGTGLPEGSGTVEQGAQIYEAQCSSCHGEDPHKPLKGYPALAGGQGTLATDKPEKTIGSYWPHATTIYDYVNRAMPFTSPQSLTPDELYAVTAYLLHANDIVPADATLDAQSLAAVKMPNADGFHSEWHGK